MNDIDKEQLGKEVALGVWITDIKRTMYGDGPHVWKDIFYSVVLCVCTWGVYQLLF